MTHNVNLYGRACATAIAAALALTSTPAISQDATVDPPAIDSVVDPLAPASEPLTDSSETMETPTVDATAVEPETAATAPAKVKRTARRAVRAPAPVPRPAVAATEEPLAEVANAPAADPQLLPPAEMPLAEAQPLPSGPERADAKVAIDEEAAVIGGSALALLALGGAAVAMRRRRRDEDDELWMDEEPAPEPRMAPVTPVGSEPALVTTPRQGLYPVPDPKPFAAPSIALGGGFMLRRAGSEPMTTSRAPAKTQPLAPARSAESWTERAMRGPTPENPSLSLKKRLKRAAFFDKRDRDAAAGDAPAVNATAGLPERAVRDFEPALT
ncbi:hypothetical protein [Sphingomonas xanthus]|uniref:LPXTG cell wall anchor domain-containing protein n=1 Tax=Sphingomonas xanthus TaxID=2594473 RepID=A0A516IRQ0_9SPHN|nr:hypothetical protein [Sphingomonas xanthus]QDP19494.1 hypothetical protein FMM02_05665 [Sphingomonas xanthus]